MRKSRMFIQVSRYEIRSDDQKIKVPAYLEVLKIIGSQMQFLQVGERASVLHEKSVTQVQDLRVDAMKHDLRAIMHEKREFPVYNGNVSLTISRLASIAHRVKSGAACLHISGNGACKSIDKPPRDARQHLPAFKTKDHI